jgi:hypothetical protein
MADGTLKVGTITTSSGSGTITIGQSGETTNIVGTLQNNGSAVATTNGITSVTTFRLTDNLTGGSDATISANLSAVSSPSGYGEIGSQVTQSSGIFTFPATGIWSIEFYGAFVDVAGDVSAEVKTMVTTDNSSYNNAAAALIGENDSDSNRGTISSKFIFDVTNTSTHKCLFRQVSFAGGTTLNGDSTLNRTYFIFTRLGDT